MMTLRMPLDAFRITSSRNLSPELKPNVTREVNGNELERWACKTYTNGHKCGFNALFDEGVEAEHAEGILAT